MDLTGNRYGKWLVIEDKQEKMRGSCYIVCQCDCGTIRKQMKSPFLSGYNSTKCLECSKKNSRIIC